jgi:hypothetical protein
LIDEMALSGRQLGRQNVLIVFEQRPIDVSSGFHRQTDCPLGKHGAGQTHARSHQMGQCLAEALREQQDIFHRGNAFGAAFTACLGQWPL